MQDFYSFATLFPAQPQFTVIYNHITSRRHKLEDHDFNRIVTLPYSWRQTHRKRLMKSIATGFISV